jgi:putative membrane protein
MKKMVVRLTALVAAGAGLTLFLWILSHVDLSAVLAAVREIGFWGVALVIAYHAVPLWLDVIAWRHLFALPRPSRRMLIWARWIGEAGNSLMPGQAGEFLRVRAAMLAGAGGTAAASSALVDLSVGVMMQIAFSLIGLALFGVHAGFGGAVLWLLAGILALTAGIAVFVTLQHRGMFGALAPLVARWLAHAPKLAGGIDQAVRATWQRPRTVALTGVCRLASCIVGAGEVWLVFWLLGAEISVGEAIALESLGQAARAAAFLIPSGLGVQEGALLFLAAALGIPPESAVALALVKRARELTLGLPALLTWQLAEFRGRRRAAAARAG